MSVLMSNKAAKRAARISSRLLSRRFWDRLWAVYTCKHEFLDPEARIDSQNQDLAPVLVRAILGRAESLREEASAGLSRRPAPKESLQAGLAFRRGIPFSTTASLFHRSNESQLPVPLMRGLESTTNRLKN